jgi:hypothetical protein
VRLKDVTQYITLLAINKFDKKTAIIKLKKGHEAP